MAQTKTRASARRSRDSRRSQARSRGSSSKSKSRASSKPRAQSKPSTNGMARVDSARHAVEEKAKDAGHVVAGTASKVKVPLLAGGAALAGAAGGLALGAHQANRKKGRGMAARRPHLKMNSHNLARAAKEVGAFGAEMGHLASELQRTREQANGARRRSPVEVVLEGLTARRSG